ncbi:hypothetical protein T492DRAFT_198006 [Pavlovales sp. CCMP2436]|nr:hypothetical protein T492DRAFT_198006 [Pavlovales sp. CCMP2436]
MINNSINILIMFTRQVRALFPGGRVAPRGVRRGLFVSTVNLSLLGLTWAELVADAARQRSLSVSALRSFVTVPPLASAKDRKQVARADCTAALDAQRSLLAGLRAEHLLPDCAFLLRPSAGFVDVLSETERFFFCNSSFNASSLAAPVGGVGA